MDVGNTFTYITIAAIFCGVVNFNGWDNRCLTYSFILTGDLKIDFPVIKAFWFFSDLSISQLTTIIHFSVKEFLFIVNSKLVT